MRLAIPPVLGILGSIAVFAAPAFPGVGDLVTVKPPFILTSKTTYTQKQPWAAMADDGSFVVIYAQGDMYARRFDAAGNPLGADFLLNPTVHPGEQDEGFVTIDPVTRDFTISWSDRHGNDGFQMGCGGRFYKADGTPYGSEFIINQTWNWSQFEPHVAQTIGGRVLAVWSDAGVDGSCGVVGRLFDKTGVALTGDILVNTPASTTQIDPSAACDRAGNFVVAFVDASGATGTPREIFARLFDANFFPKGPEFLVNDQPAGMQRECDVAMDADGDFVVTWNDESGTDGAGWGVFGRMFDKNGVAKGPQFQLSATSAGDQRDPAVMMDYVGNFTCTWEDNSSGDFDVKLRRFDRFGVPLTGDITLNTTLAGDQTFAKTEMTQSGQRLLSLWFDSTAGDDYGTLLDLTILAASPPLAVGVTSTISMELPGQGGMPYVLLAALATSPGIPVGLDRTFHLAPDALFQFLLSFPNSVLGTGYAGVLDANGRASATMLLPSVPGIHGMTLYFAPATLDPASPTGVFGLYDPVPLVVQ